MCAFLEYVANRSGVSRLQKHNLAIEPLGNPNDIFWSMPDTRLLQFSYQVTGCLSIKV